MLKLHKTSDICVYIIILLEFKENIYSSCYGKTDTLVAIVVYCPLMPRYSFTSLWLDSNWLGIYNNDSYIFFFIMYTNIKTMQYMK